MTRGERDNVTVERRAVEAAPPSALAVASLVCALLGCLPLVGSMAATILGVVALRRIRLSHGRLGGRKLALAGTLLGSIGIVLWLGLLSWMGDWYRDSLDSAMTQQVRSVLTSPAERPPVKPLSCWSKRLFDSGAVTAVEIEHFSREAAARYGPLVNFSIISDVARGSLLAPELEVAASFDFEKMDRLGAAVFEVLPGTASLEPCVRLMYLKIEDPERGDLVIPAGTTPASSEGSPMPPS